MTIQQGNFDALNDARYLVIRRVRSLIAVVLLYPALGLAITPLLQASAVYAQETPTRLQAAGSDESTISGSIDPDSLNTGGVELAEMNRAGQLLAADMAGMRRLKINAVDKAQFEAYLKVEPYAKIYKAKDPTIIDSEGNVDLAKLPQTFQNEIGVDRLSEYSRTLIASILNIVSPADGRGAGHEFANVFRITKDHRTEGNRDSEESVPPLDEEPRESQHFKDNGKAVDVSELDYLRGTTFTIETTVDAKTGKPVIKDGKPVEEVISYKHESLEPIQFVWQSEDAASKFPGTLPAIYGATPHNAAQTLAGNHLGGVLKEELSKRGNRDLDLADVSLAHVNNLGQLSRVLGQAVTSQAMERGGVQLGPNAPLWTGQTSLSQTTGLPSFGFYGQSLDGAPNGQPGLLINMGREVVQQRVLPQLPQGALAGSTSDEIFTNVGERTFEAALGNLPLGTLDGITSGDRRSLEVHVGRGVLAQHLNLFLSQVPLGATNQSFNQALGFQLDALATAPLAYDTSFDIRDTNATQQLVSGQLPPDSYLQQLGAAKLALLTVYGTETDKRRADAALNLEERPNLFTGLKELPSSPDPFTSTKDAFDGGRTTLTDAESSAASARAGYVLDRFSFSTSNRQFLESIRGGNRAGEVRFVLSDREWQAWLLDAAYVRGVNADQTPRVARFLTADTSVFYEVGTDQVAKGIAKENDQRAALRSYFRTGIMPTLDDKVTPIVDLNNVVGQIGLRSRADFEAIFRSNAPLPAFEMAGRRSLLAGFGQDQADIAAQAVAPTATLSEVQARLTALETAHTQLLAASSGETQQSLQQASTVINQLEASIDNALLAGKQATPASWTSSLINLYQVSQTAAGTADQHVAEYRDWAVALAKLADGDAAEGLYDLGERFQFNGFIGQTETSNLLGALSGTVSPNMAFRSFGNSVLAQVNGLDPNTSGLLYDLLDTATTQRTVTTEEIRTQLRSFAQDHSQELAEASYELELQTYGYDIDGAPLKLSDSASAREGHYAEAMVRLMTQGEGGPVGMKLGAGVVDDAFGIDGYQVSEDGFGTWGMVSTEIDGAIGQVMQRAQTEQKLWEILTDETNADLRLDEQQGRMMAAASAQYALNLFGGIGGAFDRHMITDPNYEFTLDKSISMLEGVTGLSIDQVIAASNIPIVGDFLADRDTLSSFLKGQVFDSTSDFWKNQAYLPQIEQLSARAGVPSGFMQALLDRNLTGEQRTERIGGVFKDYAQNQITPDRINEILGFEGTDFAVGGTAISGAVSILLNDTITDKSGAFQSLGSAIGDNYLAANFGFPVSWLWDSKTAHTDKIKTGLNILTEATGLDPAIGALAQNAYSTFFIGDGIKLDTIEGRQNMASLVGSIGLAANVPPEFVSLAAGLMTGDLETTMVTYAGQSFIDNQLIAFGITDVTFSDIYQAFVSPLPGTEALAYNTAWNEISPGNIADDSAPPLDEVGGDESFVLVRDPNTGNEVRLGASAASALNDRTSQLRDKAQATARANISYAMGDALISQAFGGNEGAVVRGITKAMMTGTADQKITAFTGMLAGLSGSSEASQIFGAAGTARELVTFFNSKPEDKATLSSGSLAQLDGWFSSVTGQPTPAGSMEALANYAKTGDAASFDKLISTDSLAANFGGFIDQGLGLPPGTTQLANAAYNAYSAAEGAVAAAQSQVNLAGGGGRIGLDFISPELASAKDALSAAQTQLALTSASLVSTGVNLIFGKQIAAIDGALGLPPGTASMLVTAGITTLMVPGMTFALLASSVFLPALAGMVLGALLSGNGIKGIFGGGTKKIKRSETLWSYHISDPDLRPTGIERNFADESAAQQAKSTLACKTEDKNLAGACLKPIEEEQTRADWPEEAWFADLKDPGESEEDANIIAPGKNIALKPDAELPAGIFRGNTKQQFRSGSVGAAQTKIHELLGDLLTMNNRLSDQVFDGRPDPEDYTYIPNEIWTHNRADLQRYEIRINQVYAQDDIGSYQEHIENYRRGVGFDEKMSLLVRWLHWQY